MEERMTPERWHRMRRLELAGLRLPTPLVAPNHPVRVEHLPSDTGYDVFPVVNGVGLAISVRIIADATITIGGYRLRWDEIPELSEPGRLKPLEPCEHCSSDRVRRYCFELTSGHSTIQLPNLERQKIWAGGMLRRGFWLKGCLSALMADNVRFASPAVAVTLHIIDLVGNEYPYPLRLNICPALVASGVPRIAGT